MKTSVIEVHAMLSVLSVEEVERWIGEVPGVESVTVNFAAKNATVRYDETRLNVADIKSSVRLRGHEPVAATAAATDVAPATPVAAAPTPSPMIATPIEHTAPPPETPKPGTDAMPAGMKMQDMAPSAVDASASMHAPSRDSTHPAATPSLFRKLQSCLSESREEYP